MKLSKHEEAFKFNAMLKTSCPFVSNKVESYVLCLALCNKSKSDKEKYCSYDIGWYFGELVEICLIGTLEAFHNCTPNYISGSF